MRLINVHMYLTPLCNLSCKHCYYDALKTGDNHGRLLSSEKVVSIINWLCEHFEADLHLEGGELFLRTDLDEIFAALSPKALSALTVTTNGTVPIQVHPDKLRTLGELRISVEGHTNELQQILRPAKLETIFRTLEKLRSDSIPFTLRATLHRTIVNYFPQMMSSFIEQGVEHISLFEFQPVGRGSVDMEKYMLDASEFETVFDELAQNGPGKGIKLLKLSLSPRRIPMALARKTALEAWGFEFVDLAGIPNLTINSNGDLGVSPWRVTARHTKDRFANVFDDADFQAKIEQSIACQTNASADPYTSSLLLRYRVPTN